MKTKGAKLNEGETVQSLAARDWQNMSDLEKKPYSDKLTIEWNKYEKDLLSYKHEVKFLSQLHKDGCAQLVL